MQQTLIIAHREFTHRVRKRGFLIITFGLPIVFVIIWLVFGLLGGSSLGQSATEAEEVNSLTQIISYVDRANLIQIQPDSIPADLFEPMADIQTAEAALENGDIAAYFVIPTDYRETGNIQRISQGLSVASPDVRWFNRLLQANLLPEIDQAQFDRLRHPFYEDGLEFVNIAPQEERTATSNSMLPLVVTLAIIMPLFTSISYLFQSIAQEKSSRMMEILLVSLRPQQLLTGKILGLGGLTLVQYIVWGGIALLVLLITGQGPGQLLTSISLSPPELAWIGFFALGGFLLYAALMAGVGALARDIEDGHAWLFVISLPMLVPIYFWSIIARDPNGSVAITLSLIPFSAPGAMLIRLTNAIVPLWQVAASLGLLFLAGLATIWLMGRLFRIQTLLSGEAISMRRMWAALRS